MKKFIAILILSLAIFLTPSCSFITSEMVSDTYRIVKDVVFTQDSIEVVLREKEVYFQFQVGQEIDTVLSDGTGVWVHFDKARKTYHVSMFEPSTKIKIKR